MKRSFYEIFDHWDATDEQLPPLTTQPVNTDAVRDRVLRQVAFSEPVRTTNRKPIRSRILGIAAAAAVLTGGTITAGAVSGRMDDFFAAISQVDSPLPAAGNATIEEVEQVRSYYNCPDVSFTGTEDAAVTLLGLYYDHNAVLLSMQVDFPPEVELPSDANVLTSFTLTRADGSVKELEQRYFEGDFRRDTSNDAANRYLLTWFLTNPELSGGTLRVALNGIYDAAQMSAVQQQIIALQEQWREEAHADELTTEQWKEIWQQENYDEKTNAAMMAYFERQDALVDATWTADIPIPAASTQTISGSACGMNYMLDDLSVYVSAPSEEQIKYGSTAIEVTLKDGTVYAEEFFDAEAELIPRSEKLESNQRYFAFNHGTGYGTEEEKGMIACYPEPISVEQVAKLELKIHYYDDTWNPHIDTYTLYEVT